MTIGAVLHDRRVLPQEGTAPFGVATEAILIERALNQLFGIGRAVRIVAARAGHLAFAEGHMRRALQLGTPHLVAPQAEFRLFVLQRFHFGKGSPVAALA